MTELYHYTCHHGRESLGARGRLLLPGDVSGGHIQRRNVYGVYAELDDLIWVTDLERPMGAALGLTSVLAECDRTAHRYRVTDTSGLRRYVAVRRGLNQVLARLLETAPGAMPMHWWVASCPVPVEYAPIGGAS